MEIEANDIEAWLLDPMNQMVSSIGLEIYEIRDFIDHVSDGEDVAAFQLHKQVN